MTIVNLADEGDRYAETSQLPKLRKEWKYAWLYKRLTRETCTSFLKFLYSIFLVVSIRHNQLPNTQFFWDVSNSIFRYDKVINLPIIFYCFICYVTNCIVANVTLSTNCTFLQWFCCFTIPQNVLSLYCSIVYKNLLQLT